MDSIHFNLVLKKHSISSLLLFLAIIFLVVVQGLLHPLFDDGGLEHFILQVDVVLLFLAAAGLILLLLEPHLIRLVESWALHHLLNNFILPDLRLLYNLRYVLKFKRLICIVRNDILIFSRRLVAQTTYLRCGIVLINLRLHRVDRYLPPSKSVFNFWSCCKP